MKKPRTSNKKTTTRQQPKPASHIKRLLESKEEYCGDGDDQC